MPVWSKSGVVIDANVIIGGFISARSIPGRVLQSWREELFDVVTSDDLVRELTNTLIRLERRYRFGESDIRWILDRLARTERRATPLS